MARWDSELAHSSTFVVPPPAAQPGAVGMNDGSGWVVPNSTYVDSFSAACWFFAQELTDMALDANETPPVLGMIQTAWGGTEIDDWIKNSSIAACKNASGDPEPNRQGPGRGGSGSVYPNNGALWNGMIGGCFDWEFAFSTFAGRRKLLGLAFNPFLIGVGFQTLSRLCLLLLAWRCWRGRDVVLGVKELK